jgi:hypothetical protein
MPSKSELREATLKNDCASARLFMRYVDAFIKFGMGIDPKTKKQMPHRGLFGAVGAYFSMVETQGRGTLHIHFLIWLSDCPANSAAVEEKLKSSDAGRFTKSVESYVRTIVTNTLPLNLSRHRCSRCGASFSHVVALPIPESARKDPQEGLYNAQAKRNISAPRFCNAMSAISNSARSTCCELCCCDSDHCTGRFGKDRCRQVR